MKKVIIRSVSLLVCMIMLLVPMTTFADEDSQIIEKLVELYGTEELPSQEINIGYSTNEIEEIFGTTSQNEIEKITNELTNFLNSQKTKEEAINVLNNKESKFTMRELLKLTEDHLRSSGTIKENQVINLFKLDVVVTDVSWSYEGVEVNSIEDIISIMNSDKNLYPPEEIIQGDLSLIDYIEPSANDTKPFSDSMNYNVDAITSKATYNISASGSIFIPNNSVSIENASGRHVSGPNGGNGRPVYGGSDMFVSFEFREGGLIKRNAAYFYVNSNGRIVRTS